MKTRSLGKSNLTLTEIGFGGGEIGGLYRSVSTQAAIETMNSALDRGIRYFEVEYTAKNRRNSSSLLIQS